MARTFGLALIVDSLGKFKYTAPVIRRLHAIVDVQLQGAVDAQGSGIRVSRYGDGSFLVTAGTGLNISIAPGAGSIIGASLPSAYIERPVAITLAVPASSTCYVWQGLENSATNRTEETGLPLSFVSTNASEPNAIPLATVTTSATAVTSVIDTRGLPIDRVDPEQIRDAFAAAVQDSATIDFTDNDAANTSTFDVKPSSITTLQLATGAVLTDDIALGQINKEVLEYIAATDIANGLALTASTWTDVVPNQTFTVERADNRQVNVFPSGCILITTTVASGGRWAAQLLFDSAGTTRTLQVGNGWIGQNQFANILQGTGTPRITGLGAGAHTVKLQIQCEVAASINCRAATVPIYENFKLRVVEGKR